MQTREQILAAALEVYAAHGFRGATTRRIAAAAGVNEVTLFRQFGGKEALLAEALGHAASQGPPASLPAQPDDVVRELTSWAQALHEHLRARRSLIRACLGEQAEWPAVAGCAVPRESFGELLAYLRVLRERRVVAADRDVATAAALLINALYGDALSRDLVEDLLPSESGVAAAYVALLLAAVGLSGERRDHRPRAAAPPSLPDATGG